MKLIKHDNDWIEIRGPITRPHQLQRLVPTDCELLTINTQRFLSAELAKSLNDFQGLRELWIWCDVGRVAVQHLLKLPNLEKLDLLCLRSPGRIISGFENAYNLKRFSCSNYLRITDLYAISKSESIEELGAFGADIDTHVVEALCRMPRLMALNLEATDLDDEMAMIISESDAITSLDIGATKITERGFEEICQMKQLENLDAWAIQLSEPDLDKLANLTNLKYLSLGVMDYQEPLSASGVISRLNSIPSLSRLWLDGIAVSKEEEEYLVDKYDYVSLT